MTANTLNRLAAFILWLFCLGCALLSGGRAKTDHAAPRDLIIVEIVNDNYYASRIHAVFDGGGRSALGTVSGNGGRLVLPIAWEPRQLAFEVHLVTGGGTYVSLPVTVSPGDSVDVHVPANLTVSGFYRRIPRRH